MSMTFLPHFDVIRHSSNRSILCQCHECYSLWGRVLGEIGALRCHPPESACKKKREGGRITKKALTELNHCGSCDLSCGLNSI